ncbi:hsp70 family protein [Anaeramoeba flamelloides]|uniref:Hsp70 family protein n=1 Tax=Anaeramoeba flamelloides TaxID=1746091 RepID=A0ABQ8XPR4_9EUKA|nr:hsp70 family protein [Anaeramoeba flamelloides]
MLKIILDPQAKGNYKTKTIILFQRKGVFGGKWEVIEFGITAEKKYLRLKNKTNYRLFKYFKMKLYTDNLANLTIQSVCGEKWEFTRVLSGLFEYIFLQLRESIKNYDNKLKIILESIQWVLTVPAIWNEQAKEIMRRSFYQAHLLIKKNSPNLLFCYEPEVAVLDFFQEKRNQLNEFKKKNILVIDAGGGTIDITLIEPVIENNKITEFKILMIPKGGDFGSTYIDQQFIEFFQSLLNFNENQFNLLKKNCAVGYINILNNWEKEKLSFKMDESTEEDEYYIGIPRSVVKYLNTNYTGMKMKNMIKQFNEKNPNSKFSKIGWDNEEDRLIINGDRIKHFFKTPINKFKEYLLNEKEKSTIFDLTDVVFFTGGLSYSDYFVNSMKKFLGSQYHYYVSAYSDKSILHGALLFGFDPTIVTERISPYTYGAKFMVQYKPNRDAKNRIKPVTRNNQYMELVEIFQPFVFIGEKIKLNDPIKNSCWPIQSDQKRIKTIVLRTNKEKWDTKITAVYPDSPNVTQISSFDIIIPSSQLPLIERKFETSFNFATTEFTINCKYLPNPTISEELILKYNEN